MTWLRLAKRSSFFAYLFPPRKPEIEEYDFHPPMMHLLKLVSGLPEILGKTIAHVVMKPRGKGRSQIYFVFTDDTHYELYNIDTLNGGRGVYDGGLDLVRRNLGEPELVVEVCSSPTDERTATRVSDTAREASPATQDARQGRCCR